MKDLGTPKCFLGIEFSIDKSSITLSQKQYMLSVLKKFDMTQCKPRSNPCELGDETYSSVVLFDDVSKYRKVVGSLIYMMLCTRPDLSYIITKLSQKLSNPTEGDWKRVNHVLRYIKHTLDYCLKYKRCDKLKLIAHADADWASNSDRKSISGYAILLNSAGPLIAWKSKKQHITALSTCEAEYVALTLCSQEVLFIKQLLITFDIFESHIDVYGDNQGSLALAKNPVFHFKSKHIDVKLHFIRDLVKYNHIHLNYVPTNQNISDLMTKMFSKSKLKLFMLSLFG